VNYAGCGLAWKKPPKALDLFIPNVQPAHEGRYYAVLTNGLERLTSAVATLTVISTSMSPRLECPSVDWCFTGVQDLAETNLIVAPNQIANLAVKALGFPRLTFSWSRSVDGIHFEPIPGADSATLVFIAQPDDSGIYRVRVENTLGTVYADARLTVQEKAQLKITEAMSDECFGAHDDWWELTNTGKTAVNLCGYRWDNHPGQIGAGPTISKSFTLLANGSTNTNNTVIIQPGESIIFLESQPPKSFVDWWGATNLPFPLQFVIYSANGLDAAGDEEIDLWNPPAVDDFDFLDQALFSEATPCTSFWFDPAVCLSVNPPDNCPECGKPSVQGQCGAFRAAEGGEVGSPGWTRWTPPRLTDIRREGGTVKLTWKAQPGSTNVVQYATCLTTGAWTNLAPPLHFDGAIGMAEDFAVNHEQRFYRITNCAPANCQCPP
jgi:hypothetical protein